MCGMDYIRLNDTSFKLNKIEGIVRKDYKLYILYITYRWKH